MQEKPFWSCRLPGWNRSADERVLDELIRRYGVRSLVVVGCGSEDLMTLAREKGLHVFGVSDDPRIRETASPNENPLIFHDFASGPLVTGERFDLAWSTGFLQTVPERDRPNCLELFGKAKYTYCRVGHQEAGADQQNPGHNLNYWREVFRIHHLLYDHGVSRALRKACPSTEEDTEAGMFFVFEQEGPMERFTGQLSGQAELLEWAVRLVRPGERVLDLGAGRCEAARQFAQAHCQVTALGMHFHRYLNAAGLAELHELGVELEETPFENYDRQEMFDAIWCAHMLEHQRNPGWFLDRCLSLLRPDGWLFLSVPPLKTQVVSGHLSVWFPGLLLYNLVVAGLDCSTIHMTRIGYNIAAFVHNRQVPLPNLTSSLGDIERLAGHFPPGLAHQGFEGDFDEINWPPC